MMGCGVGSQAVNLLYQELRIRVALCCADEQDKHQATFPAVDRGDMMNVRFHKYVRATPWSQTVKSNEIRYYTFRTRFFPAVS